MQFLTSTIEAQLHRETYVALLDSLLRLPGSKRELAHRARITPNYLSYILKLDRDPYSIPIIRTPSLKVAHRIARAISAPPEIRETLLWHMVSASEKRIQADQIAKRELLERSIAEVVVEVAGVHSQATFAFDPGLAKSYYRAARDITSNVLKQIQPERNPLDYVELCHIIHDAQCVLNRPDDALWHAKLARTIIDSLDPFQYHRERERLDYRAINSVRAEAVALHSLGKDREALYLYEQACTMEAMKQRGSFWKPHVYLDKIKALAGLPRFSITEVENLADEVRRICEKRSDSYDPLLLLLHSEALARAYIQHENYKDAKRVLEAEYAQFYNIPHIGPLHRVMFLRTFAKLCWKTNDRESWKCFIDSAYLLANEAGLQHQEKLIEDLLQESYSEPK